ncbi:MAG: hypothetical protein HYU58_13020 [Proteobacteria bacterium]|nr:hypothetical protein [Pseudomonadota bacterium]
MPGEAEFEDLERDKTGLISIELDTYLGFVFIRFIDDSGPSVAEQFAPFHDALSLYRIAEMEPFGQRSTTDIRADWKVAVDNNIEAYHVAMGHPGLQRLYRPTYSFEVKGPGVSCGGGPLRDKTSTN